jgi:integrase/recombinase XerD
MELWRRVRFVGPLLPYVAGFAAELAKLGYAERTVDETVRAISHLSKWMSGHRLEVGELTPAVVERFLRDRRRSGRRVRSMVLFGPLLVHLRTVGAIRAGDAPPPTPVDELCDAYSRYLGRERGMVPSTVRAYTQTARNFLRPCLSGGVLDLNSLTGRDVIRVVLQECRRRKPGSANRYQSELRRLLQFLELEGRVSSQLSRAVPRGPRWRDAYLPRAMKPEEEAQLLGACERDAAAGCRDFAVLKLLSRLGLRSREVANLTLEDIDWRHGEITVRSKGRCEQLPLPADVGEALYQWLRRRPGQAASRHVFLTVNAPVVGISSSGVTTIVRRVSGRAGLDPVGAHRLRHTAATAMLRSGASLAEVGQVLRHQELQTTAIYAKVDHVHLRELARPWPGAAR